MESPMQEMPRTPNFDSQEIPETPSVEPSISGEFGEPQFPVPALRTSAGGRLENTPCGPWKNISRLETYEKVYLVACYLALTISVGFTIERLVSGAVTEDDSTYGLILLFAAGFSYIYVTTGVFQEQPHEMMAFCLTNVIVFGYVTVNFVNYAVTHGHEPDHNIWVMKLLRVVFTTLVSAILIPIGFWLARRYYKTRTLIAFTLGSASAQLQKMCQTLFFTISLIKFDLQLEINLLILVMREGVSKVSGTELTVLFVGAFITLLWSLLGNLAIRFENKWLVLAFMGLSFPNLVYAGVKFYMLRSVPSAHLIFKITIMCGVSAVIVRIAAMVFMYRTYKNFGNELKEKVFKWDTTNAAS